LQSDFQPFLIRTPSRVSTATQMSVYWL